MAAEGPLHDLGAISIVNTDSQGMGRIGETVRRTWQLAHVMKSLAGIDGRVRLAERTRRRQRTGPALPGEGHGRAGTGSRAAGGGRLAHAWSPGRSGPVGSGVVRCQARRRDEGRGRGVGTDRRGQRIGPWRGAHAVRPRLGRHRAMRWRPCPPRSSPVLRSTLASPTRSPPGAGWSRSGERAVFSAPTCVANTTVPRDRGVARGRHRHARWTGPGASNPSRDVPLNRRYFLS